jgi:sulfane dehydrogenase subunit SoxC
MATQRDSDDLRISRRALLTGAAGAAVGSVLAGAHASAKASEGTPGAAPPDPTKHQGHGPTPLGSRSPFEQPRRGVRSALPDSASTTPLQDLRGILTPSDLHFERHHAGVPRLDPQRYALLVHGMVARPTRFGLDDLKRFPARSQLYFIECSGNGYRGYAPMAMRETLTPQEIDGLTSTSEWIGVPLATLLREVGAEPRAKWLLAESTDAALTKRSIPMEKAWDDAMIAYGQNGEALRPEQGYPARLLLPGWEGSAQIKWIRRIELSDRPFMTREETARYTDPLADGTARIFSFEMDAKSIITFPACPVRLDGPGWWEIRGLAWSGRGRVSRVEVSTDGGDTWKAATLQGPVLPKCHTRFRYLWRWRGGTAVLMSRAVDETGYVQPTRAALTAARGPGTLYHTNNIRAWRVLPDGRVLFAVDA